MKATFAELFSYLKSPVLEKDPNTNVNYRIQKLFHLLIISIITGVLLSPIFGLIEKLDLIDLESHAMEKLLNSYSKLTVLFFAVILAPVIEELFFRAPLTLFKSKRFFSIVFYFFAILFGLVHITNYEASTNVLLLAPILILPQTILGGYLGFIRVRFGLIWSILLHSMYNAFFLFITFASEI